MTLLASVTFFQNLIDDEGAPIYPTDCKRYIRTISIVAQEDIDELPVLMAPPSIFYEDPTGHSAVIIEHLFVSAQGCRYGKTGENLFP